jgi:hypothetical protein
LLYSGMWRRIIWLTDTNTEQVGWSGNASDSYSGSARFESQLGRRLTWLRVFVVFFSTRRQVSRQNLPLCCYHFQIRFNSFHIIIQSFDNLKSEILTSLCQLHINTSRSNISEESAASIFHPEDGGIRFLRNVCIYGPNILRYIPRK